MKIYNAHPVTGEFIGEGMADPDPLEIGNWLIPAHAFTDEPPVAGKNQAAVRTDNGWELVADYRGTTYYMGTPEARTIEELGVTVPEGATETPPPPSTAELTALAIGKRDGLLGVAALRIAPLQDAVDLGDATDAETAALKSWKQYRVALNRIEQKSGFPSVIDWPAAPA
ncbi:tail fiber assembly protein [Pseudomonas asplenii]|uniref:tail fiber assembly protein n=1 Tax=Pseudomonas asplenii TaxID=53407 RepID=UPI00036ACF24|nr:tail fiber assembly protein [Pseudomonas fuscovaginae]